MEFSKGGPLTPMTAVIGKSGAGKSTLPERRHCSRNPKWGLSNFGFREQWRRSSTTSNIG